MRHEFDIMSHQTVEDTRSTVQKQKSHRQSLQKETINMKR